MEFSSEEGDWNELEWLTRSAGGGFVSSRIPWQANAFPLQF